jgi:hypothetical protein
LDGERKTVTALIGDITGTMALLEDRKRRERSSIQRSG